MAYSSRIFGYTGGAQRVVATVDGVRRPIAWGDDITDDELGAFMTSGRFVDVDVELVEDPVQEARDWPLHHGIH